MAFDIHIEGVPYSQIHGGKGLSFGDYQFTVGVQGVQKMVDRFLKCFFTPLGSDLTDKEYGSSIMAYFGNSGSGMLQPVVYTSVQQCVATLQRYDDQYDTASEERIQSAAVEEFVEDVDSTGFFVKVRLSNSAGTTVTILVADALRA